MRRGHDDKQVTPTSLPRISEGIIKRFQRTSTNFEALYLELKKTNPEAASWLLGAAEDIAPADAAQKEYYATLALALFHMLNEQALVNRLSALYDDSFEGSSGTPSIPKPDKPIHQINPDRLP